MTIMNRSLLPQIQKTLLFLGVALFIAFLYTFLHEGGHALVGLLSGGTISVFNISFWNLDAHVEMTGSLTPAQAVINNLAGVGLPLLIWLGFMLLVPKRANFALESIKVVGSLMFLSTLLAWIVLPVLFLAGQSPSDDVINFINNSGLHPLWVTIAALLAFVAGWRLFSARIGGLRGELDLFRKADGFVFTPALRSTVFSMLGIFALCALAAFSANGFKLSSARADPFAPPQGYSLVTKIDLSRGDYDQTDLFTFTLDQPAPVGIFLLVEDIDTRYFEVKLTSPQAEEYKIIHAEGYTARRDIPHMEKTLPPGQYSCILTSKTSPGMLSIYTKGTPPLSE